MYLSEFEDDPLAALRYSERYVNDGSPSGFTERYRTSQATDPFGDAPFFYAYALNTKADDVETFGYVPERLFETFNWHSLFLIHPDMLGHQALGRYEAKETSVPLSPTASARTAEISLPDTPFYLKFHYDGIIGRTLRALPRKRAVAGVEASQELRRHPEIFARNPRFSILEEPGAQILKPYPDCGEDETWGLIIRTRNPYPFSTEKQAFNVPFFALYSTDRKHPEHPTLIQQIYQRNPETFTDDFRDLTLALIDIYFDCVEELGLQFENNAQNLTVSFDSSWRPTSIILRDLMGFTKDLTIRQGKGLQSGFQSHPYRCISTDQGEEYTHSHSFSFDFKLGTYIFDPLIAHMEDVTGIDQSRTVQAIRDRTRTKLERLPPGYLPQNEWYRNRPVMDPSRYPYVRQTGPKYR